MGRCYLCPKGCGAERETGGLGFCGVDNNLYVARTMLHRWEEPCICYGAGAGTVFFSGCNLHCVYCQNSKISGGRYGKIYSEDELQAEIFKLRDAGASCIEFVTPTHYTDILARVLGDIKPALGIPVVWNSGGYERVESLGMLEGLVDIYLPDLKYFSPELSRDYSHAEDYFTVAAEAILEMLRQTGAPQFDGDGHLSRGVIVRHLVLPAQRADSIRLLEELADALPDTKHILLSLMSQYTPEFYVESHPECEHKNLARRVTSFEYNSVTERAISLGFEGYFQERTSASAKFTPDF